MGIYEYLVNRYWKRIYNQSGYLKVKNCEIYILLKKMTNFLKFTNNCYKNYEIKKTAYKIIFFKKILKKTIKNTTKNAFRKISLIRKFFAIRWF